MPTPECTLALSTTHAARYGHVPVRGLISLIVFVLLLGYAGRLHAQTGTPTGPETLASFGMIYESPSDVPNFMSDNVIGVTRMWDDGISWPAFAPTATNGVPNWSSSAFTALDNFLANDFANYNPGQTTYGNAGWFTLGAHTPYWALGNGAETCSTGSTPTYIPSCDTNCNYYTASGWNLGTGTGTSTASPGQCYPPNLVINSSPDLAINGSGQDSIWKAWVTKIANHANGLDGNPDYTYPTCAENSVTCHAHIHYWDIWNEFDVTGNDDWNNTGGYISTDSVSNGVFFIGSYAQLVRMTEDADCIIRGSFSSNGAGYINYIHNDPTLGTETQCTGAGIDKNAVIVTPSSHAYSQLGWTLMQNFLYCDGASEVGSGSVTTGSPEYCNTSGDGAAAIGAINFHMKPGNTITSGQNGFEVEKEMLNEYCEVVGKGVTACSNTGDTGILQTAELDKPFYNGEGGYSGSGWSGPTGGLSTNLSNSPDYQASFTLRYLLTMWTLGIQNSEWYQYDSSNNLVDGSGNLTEAGNAYFNLAEYIAADDNPYTMTTPCTNTSSTVWECAYTYDGGSKLGFIWDSNAGSSAGGTGTGYPCTSSSGTDDGASCATHEVSVSGFTYYENLITAVATQIPTSGANKGKVPVGVIPIMLLN